MKRVRVIITGNVQGVFFRANVKEKAVELDLEGYVRNLDDGSVEAVFEGEEMDIEEMLEFCKEGPRKASVLDLEIIDEEYTGDFDGFEVRV